MESRFAPLHGGTIDRLSRLTYLTQCIVNSGQEKRTVARAIDFVLQQDDDNTETDIRIRVIKRS